MSAPDSADDTVWQLLLLMPRLVGRAKRMRPPAELQSFDLAPRHLSLLALLLLDGPQTVSQLAARLGVAAATGERPGPARVTPARLTGSEAPGDTRPSEG
ncbi:hypothetical protein [Nocardia sp. NPDC002869]|uniref:hypothetical protein n=1 Tax=Nocardia sp. NPDC002869 TaxID=3161032 RepID=UPI00398D46F7